MNQTELVLVRHGETDPNVERRFARFDAPLNHRGREQAQFAADKLERVHFSWIFTGRSRRTRDTARILLAGVHTAAHVRTRGALDEINFGRFTGLTFDEASERFPKAAEQYVSSWTDFTFPNGGSVRAFLARMQNFFAWILSHCSGRILLVGSGGPLLALLQAAEGKPMTSLFERRIDNCEIVTVRPEISQVQTAPMRR